MQIKVALAGNPNCGKTTLFNALTGSNQYVGNWPGVTVEKKEGNLKHREDVRIIDLPGIYSLSPYTLEEVVTRDFLLKEQVDVILNIVDGTNLERNLYLTTQLMELGIPVVIAINMMDIVEKQKDHINIKGFAQALHCPLVEISALKNKGLERAMEHVIQCASVKQAQRFPSFGNVVEDALTHIKNLALQDIPKEQKRWYAIKVFEHDDKVMRQLNLSDDRLQLLQSNIEKVENEFEDDAESIITNERYQNITTLIHQYYKKKSVGALSISDKIDRIVTNRFLALPIFAIVMFFVYLVSVTTIGTMATDWANDGVFGDGWHLFGIGSSAYGEASEAYELPSLQIEAFEAMLEEQNLALDEATSAQATALVYDEYGQVERELPVTYEEYQNALSIEEPDPSTYGIFIQGIPTYVSTFLESIHCAPWLQALILDGIIAGVGAVLGFVPQMMILFFLLAFLEGCGYMSRIAFVMDRIFRKFGLSGKSFIPMLIGSGCGVPGIMASRTIENERDRRMTIITTTFIPCGAKLPIIALIAGAMFQGAWWVAPSAYFIGIAAIVLSGIILKKTSSFAGEPAVFVMELPSYHLPTLGNLLRSMWERAASFIKKAGTIILLSSVVLWFLMNVGYENGFGMVEDLNNSFLANIGNSIAWLFAPLGWGTWEGAVATFTGLIAKENVVGTFGVLFGGFDEVAENGWQIWANMRLSFTPLAAYSFLVFNLLCAPCFAAMGAIKREMNNTKWTIFAIAYQCGFAYAMAFIIFQIGSLWSGESNYLGALISFAMIAFLIYMVMKPYKENQVFHKKHAVKVE